MTEEIERPMMSIGNYPNKFFYYVAKKWLGMAYSKNVAEGFFSFTIRRKKRDVVVECFNHGAFVYLSINEGGIKHSGNYRKHRRVDGKQIVSEAMRDIDNIPRYYSITHCEGISSYIRCESDIERGKQMVLDEWNNRGYPQKLKEPINWVIKEI